MIGPFLLYIVIILGTGTVLALLWEAHGKRPVAGRQNDDTDRWPTSRILTWLTVIALTGASLYLAMLLLTGEFSVRYVWQHSASYDAVRLRLSALGAGAEGSLLL